MVRLMVHITIEHLRHGGPWWYEDSPDGRALRRAGLPDAYIDHRGRIYQTRDLASPWVAAPADFAEWVRRYRTSAVGPDGRWLGPRSHVVTAAFWIDVPAEWAELPTRNDWLAVPA